MEFKFNGKDKKTTSIDGAFSLCKRWLYAVCYSPYFPILGLNTETYGVNLRIQSECGKYRPEKLQIKTFFTQCWSLTLSTSCTAFNTVIYWVYESLSAVYVPICLQPK